MYPSFDAYVNISIHAPHEGVRQNVGSGHNKISYFNPRTPRGGATNSHSVFTSCVVFQSTHPTRGCDFVSSLSPSPEEFQSTHPTRGCDITILPILPLVRYFNPRTPRGGATAICCSLISRVTTCCRPNITPLLDVVRFLNYCTNLLLFLGEPPRLFRTASGSPMSLHY